MIWERSVLFVRGLRLLLGVAVALAATASVAQAATVINLNDGGPGSLRQAIIDSAAGDTITFDPSLNGHTIALTTGALVIPHALTISGPVPVSITVNAGLQSDRVFDIEAGTTSDVTISGLAITGGTIAGNGAGIFANSVRTLTLTGDVIDNNQVSVSNPPSQSGGGGVYVNDATLNVNNSMIDDNTVTFTGTGNSHSGGGGVYNNGGLITVIGSDVSNNTVDQATSTGFSGGGGIYSNGSEVAVTGSTVNDNTATISAGSGGLDGGGGIYSDGGPVSLVSSGVDDNTFGLNTTTSGRNGGGGVYSNGDDVTIQASSVDANTMDLTDTSTGGRDGGGGIYNNGGDVSAFLSSVSENFADLHVSGNLNGGGGVFDQGANDQYFNTTISANMVTLSGAGALNNGGGGIRSAAGGQISNTTIAGNSINAAGGGLFLDGGSFGLEDTILAGNGATNCAVAPGGGGGFASAGTNLESANTCGLIGTGDLTNTDPQLGPLRNNGGPTLTQALPAGSPAVDTGACADIFGIPLTVDQRGVARPQPAGGKCDIGAFELAQSGSGGSGPPPPPPPPPSTPPAAVPGTLAATSSTGAGFAGSVNPQGQATTVFFQYGIDARFRPGGGTAIVYDEGTTPQTLPADSTPHPVSASVTGLVPNAIYHARLVATNASGTSFGPDQTFTTPADPPPPAPVIGQTVNAKPVSGKVFVLVGTKLVPLTEGQQLPSGTVVDSRAGSLQLTTAPASGRKGQTGVFGGAIFKLTQARAGAHRGLTTLSLLENAFAGAPTYASCPARRAADGSAAAVSSKTLQLLHASAHGKFQTSGRYAAATVRGTNWTTADRCDGTLVRDQTGSVAVTDFVRHKTIVLHAGQSYLANARRSRAHK